MPIYEYRCLECGEVFSHLFLHSTDAAGQTQCSACGSDQTRRLISSFAIGGKDQPGAGRGAWPTSWGGTKCGGPETLRYLRQRNQRGERLGEKEPEARQP